MALELGNNEIHITGVNPKINMEGTEVNAKQLSIRENGGVIEIYDESTGTVVMILEVHASRHEQGGEDEINVDGLHGTLADPQPPQSHASTHSEGGTDPLSGITASQLATDTIKIVVPIAIPDSNQSNLAADSTGVKWTSNFKFKVDPQNLKSAVIRATWTASDTDSVTAVEVYDEGAATVLGSVSGNTGTDAEGTISGFTTGNLITVRLNVTTASATAGATTSLNYVVIELTYGAG